MNPSSLTEADFYGLQSWTGFPQSGLSDSRCVPVPWIRKICSAFRSDAQTRAGNPGAADFKRHLPTLRTRLCTVYSRVDSWRLRDSDASVHLPKIWEQYQDHYRSFLRSHNRSSSSRDWQKAIIPKGAFLYFLCICFRISPFSYSPPRICISILHCFRTK